MIETVAGTLIVNGASAHSRSPTRHHGGTGRPADVRTGRAAFRDALVAFVATRPLVLLAGYLAVLTIGLGPRPGFVLSQDPLANLPARFDAGWYGGIALSGYDRDFNFERQRNTAFFPAMPLLTRPVGRLFGAQAFDIPRERRMLRMLWAGTVVSLAACVWALWYVSRLARDTIGPAHARAAALLLSAYPFAVFYGAPYTESLFLLGTVATFFHFARTEWWRASAWGLLVGLTRPNGCFLTVPLAALAYQQWRAREPHSRVAQAAAVLAPTAGMLAFTLYLYSLSGVWFAWARSHEAWGRSFAPLAPFAHGWTVIESGTVGEAIARSPFDTLNAAALVFACALLVPVFRRLGIAMGLFVAINLALPLASGGVLSMGRMTSTMFPVFFALAAMLPPGAVPAVTAVFGVLQGLAAALFFTWRELF